MNNECFGNGYVLVSDYVKPNTGEDVSDALQELILANPRKTLFFPDGEYLLSKPICTPAHPDRSVALQLANYAVIKAMDCWDQDEALIRLGAAEPFNCTVNYFLAGGIIDGNGLANGVSIDSGRETSVRNVSIRNTKIGLHIKDGANNHSSDEDIFNVNIVGRGTLDSIGLLIEGCDNTVTNMRIARVQIGVKLTRGGNYLRNIHPLYSQAHGWGDYKDSVAFYDIGWSNWYDYCYSDQYGTGFYLKDGIENIYHNCFAMWWKKIDDVQNGFKVDGKFCSTISYAKIALHADHPNSSFMTVKEPGGWGIVDNPIFVEERSLDKSYRDYLTGKVVCKPSQNN